MSAFSDNDNTGVKKFSDLFADGRLDQASPLEATGEAMMKSFDPFGMVTSILQVGTAWMLHPHELSRAMVHIGADMMKLHEHAMARALGLPSPDVVTANPDDTRFVDSAWRDKPTWSLIKEYYLALTHVLQDMTYVTPGMSEKEKSRAAFWLRTWLNAAAPPNFFWTNPVAINKFLASNGKSLAAGIKNFQRDQKAKDILMVEENAFVLGKDLATTPGQVVFRNALLELIQYTATTATVEATPIVIVTPWINKFYILDLTAKKSMVKYLVDKGYTVFITSWKNPTAQMQDTQFDDYLTDGAQAAITAAQAICAADKVHLVGYCIGGTLVSTYMAWANRQFAAKDLPVLDWTLFNSLTDFSRPGDIEVFIDKYTVAALTAKMKQQGFLAGQEMAASFRLLRSNSLIWNYWVSSYLYGEQLTPFDVLYWNMDNTRMPAAMHSFYLREMYLNNNLMKRDKLNIAGQPIDMDRITQPLYMVTSVDDHIVPWKQSYRTHKYVNVRAAVRFVRSSSGHILGIVNPEVTPPRRSYRVADLGRNEHWEHWLGRTQETSGSWWGDWANWLSRAQSKKIKPPQVHKNYPPLCPAPGEYVLEK